MYYNKYKDEIKALEDKLYKSRYHTYLESHPRAFTYRYYVHLETLDFVKNYQIGHTLDFSEDELELARLLTLNYEAKVKFCEECESYDECGESFDCIDFKWDDRPCPSDEMYIRR